MKTPSNSYWASRADARMAKYHRSADATVRTITRAYDKGLQDINREIEKIFGTFATNGEMTVEEAARILNDPISRSEWNAIKDKISYIKDPMIKRRMLNRLNAPAYAARITRLQALKENTYIQAKIIADAEITASTSGYMDTINDAYYRTMFDSQKGLGVGFEFAAMSTRSVKTILKNPWSGEHFSKRIWRNTDVLASQVTDVITAGLNSGAGMKKMRDELAERMEVGKHAANRIVRTETTYMANAAEMESYEETEIDRYKFLATLDNRTSPQCQEQDGKVYDTKDAEPGVNMPPMHPFCRSTTIAYFGSDARANIQRRARDPITGKNVLVPAGTTYGEWCKGLDEQHGKDRIDGLQKQIQNKAADKKQFDRYRDILGSDSPKSLSAFQDLKYNKPDEWASTKRQVGTFKKIEAGTYSDAYKDRLRGAYREFQKDGHEFTIHGLNRVEGQKTGKGKQSFTRQDVRDLLKNKPNYVQPDGNWVVRDGHLSAIKAKDTGEIVSIISSPKPRGDWVGV